MSTETNVIKQLPVKLDEQEINKIREELGVVNHTETQIEQKKKAANEVFNEELKKARTRRTYLSEVSVKGFELKPVPCAWHIDGLEKILIRSDTGEEIERQALTAQERQTKLIVVEEQQSNAAIERLIDTVDMPTPEPTPVTSTSPTSVPTEVAATGKSLRTKTNKAKKVEPDPSPETAQQDPELGKDAVRVLVYLHQGKHNLLLTSDREKLLQLGLATIDTETEQLQLTELGTRYAERHSQPKKQSRKSVGGEA